MISLSAHPALRLATTVAAVAAGACAGPRAAPPPATTATAAAPAPPPPRAAWALTWHGAAIGGAWERDDGVRFERREQIVVRRGDEVVVSELAITIDRDAAGAPIAIDVARWQDGPVLAGVATATALGGWRVDVEGEPTLVLPPAVPFELAVRAAAAAGGFRGRVVLAGWGFAIADLDLRPTAGGAYAATLGLDEHTLHATVRYADDGAVAELIGGDGVIARRAALDVDLRPPTPAEVVDGNALIVEAGGAAVAGAPTTIVLPEATAPPPPPLPGQRPLAGGWVVALDAAAPGQVAAATAGRDRAADIAALVHQVAAAVDDDLGTTAATAGAARAATRGDCTTHALRFAALAADAGIAARVVTGLRLDDGALVRHRWNLAWTGTRWLTVDATWDEAPAAPVLLGLAVHGARAADLATADATAFDGLGRRAVVR